MNAISFAISRITLGIQPEILKLAFAQSFGRYNHRQLSIEDNILSTVIRPHVMFMCNATGGVRVNIPLAKVPREEIDPFNIVYHVPKSMTDGRSIVIAHNVSFVDPYGRDMMTSSSQCGQGTLTSAIDSMINSQGALPYNGTFRVYLVNENSVLLRGQVVAPDYAFLDCTLTYDPNMNDLNPRYYQVFAKACMMAVKAYIYTNLSIALEEGYLQGGKELGRIKDVIDGWSDQFELLENYRDEHLARALFTADENRMEQFMRAMWHIPS